jgi:hypothetical protein
MSHPSPTGIAREKQAYQGAALHIFFRTPSKYYFDGYPYVWIT